MYRFAVRQLLYCSLFFCLFFVFCCQEAACVGRLFSSPLSSVRVPVFGGRPLCVLGGLWGVHGDEMVFLRGLDPHLRFQPDKNMYRIAFVIFAGYAISSPWTNGPCVHAIQAGAQTLELMTSFPEKVFDMV